MKITTGPFRGIEINTNEIGVYIPYGSTEPAKHYWMTPYRMRHFLEKYPPSEGYGIRIQHSPGPFDLPDYRKQEPQHAPLVQPTHLFIASFVHRDVVLAQASTLAIIDGPSAWERGEDIARGRLLAACGLPTWIDEPNVSDARSPASKVSTTIPLAMPSIHSPQASHQPQEPASGAVADQDGPSKPAVKIIEFPPGDAVRDHEVRDDNAPAMISTSINTNLRDQILQLSKFLNVPVPKIETTEQAKTFYRELLIMQSNPGASSARGG